MMKWFSCKQQDTSDANNNNNQKEEPSSYEIEQEPATPYEAAELQKDAGGGDEERRGHLFFGCLCDMRIATVLMNCISIAVRVCLILIEVYRGIYTFMAMEYCLLVLSIIGLWGALNYMSLCTGVSTVGVMWFFFVHVLAVASSSQNQQHWYQMVLEILVIYPTAVLTYEIQNGIMSKDRYAKEEYLQPKVRSHVAGAMV
jgi:hypothetical protein